MCLLRRWGKGARVRRCKWARVTSDVPLFGGALVIGMANSSSVISLEVSNTGGGMLIALLLVNEGAMVDGGC